MYLSETNRELLIDLVWNKLDCIETHDREDRRVVKSLEACLKELSRAEMARAPDTVHGRGKGRGRRCPVTGQDCHGHREG